MEWELLSFAFLFGAFSSIGICLASCTPILVAFLMSSERDPRIFINRFFTFIGVRTISFVALTLVILLIGELALNVIESYSLVLRIIGGAIIVGAGLLIFFNIGAKLKFFSTKGHGFTMLALLFGIKPCLPHIAIWGYVLMVVGVPLVEGAIMLPEALLRAVLISMAFTLGENVVPAILGLLGGKATRYFYGRGFRIATKVGGAILVVLGIGFIFYDAIAPGLARLFA